MLQEGAFEGQFTAFSFATLANLLFSDKRGLFVYMPVLLMAVVGVIDQYRRKRAMPMLFCLGGILSSLFVMSCFIRWDAGDTSGPRHLIFSIPFWCLLLPGLSRMGPVERVVFVMTAALAAANMLVVNAVNTMVPFNIRNPLYGHLYPEFFRGHVRSWEVTQVAGGPAHILNNLGFYALGLDGLWSIAPVVLLGLAGGLALAYLTRDVPPAGLPRERNRDRLPPSPTNPARP